MLYLLIFFIIVLFILFVRFYVVAKKFSKENAGLIHILEKSEQARISAEKLKNKILLMVDDLQEGIIIIDKDDKISIINNKAEKFLGVHRKQVLNKPVLELRDLSNVEKIIFPVLGNFRGAPSRFHREEIQVRKNLILDLRTEPMVFEKNNVGKMIILHDITKIKSAESSKDQFISLVAHQIKSPLSAIRLSFKMLLDKNFGKLNKEQKEILEKTYKKNESLIYLVEDLLKEAKIEETGSFDNKSLINLEELTLPIVDFYKDEMKSKKISFKFEKPSKKLPEVLADQERIKMVIQNLFDNAVKYTPPEGRIEIIITPKKREIEFAIKDSGIGIPEDQKERIFSRFSRAVNVVKAKTAGSGLGLFIAKNILEKYHGKIWFNSKENEGSTFFFTLPIARY